MPGINWNLLDTQNPQKMGALFDPRVIAQKRAQEQQMQQRGQLQGLQLQEAQSNAAALGGLNPEQQRQIRLGVPARDVLMPKGQDSGLSKINQKDYTQDSFREFLKTGGKDRSVLQVREKGPMVRINTGGQETEESKTVGKGFGELYVNLNKSARDASGKIARLDRIGELLQGVETGALTPIGTKISALSKSMGIDIDPNLSNKQAAEALSNEFALQMRNPAGGAGMPGAMSDKDREFLQRIVPGLGKTPGGNKLIIETMKKLSRREQDVAKLARKYRLKNGALNDGFYVELQAFSEANPLFTDTFGGTKTKKAETVSGFNPDKESRYQAWKASQGK